MGYAPPEVLNGFQRGEAIAAHPSHDIWSLGIMVRDRSKRECIWCAQIASSMETLPYWHRLLRRHITFGFQTSSGKGGALIVTSSAPLLQVFEALTHTRAFCGFGSAAVAMAAAAGESAYPWEVGAPGGLPQLLSRSKLRDVVISCLARDPVARPTASQLRACIDSIGQATSTHTLEAPTLSEPTSQTHVLASAQPAATSNGPAAEPSGS